MGRSLTLAAYQGALGAAVEGVKTSRQTERRGLTTVPKDSTHLPVPENWPGDSAVLRWDSGSLQPLFNSRVPWESGPVIWGEVAFFSQGQKLRGQVYPGETVALLTL